MAGTSSAKTRFALLPGHDEVRKMGPGSATQHYVLRRARETRSVIQKAPQLPGPRRMLQLAQRLGLDLTNTLARHRELLADFFQGVVGVHADAEAHAQHAFLARRQRGQNP